MIDIRGLVKTIFLCYNALGDGIMKALITGASSGIGYQIALYLDSLGY